MIEKEYIETLLEKDESPILEFKREWYWLDDAEEKDRSQYWGEFYKDIISLCNGYTNYVGKTRYLIYGFCENERSIYSVDYSRIASIRNTRDLKRKVIERLENLLNTPLLEFDVEFVTIKNKTLLVFQIPCPKNISELKSQLTTKTRTLDPGAVLIRKGQNSDSVRTATPAEYESLKIEFSEFKSGVIISALQEKNAPKQRSIATTVQLYIERNASYIIDVDYPKSHRDRAENIFFELFRISEAFGGKKYFLYIHENAAQAKTYGYLKKNNLLDPANPPIVLTERPTTIKDSDRRKENIAQIFKTSLVFFIDEFGFDHIYSDYIQKYEKYNQPVFVESLSKEQVGESTSAMQILRNWYESLAAPVMIIKGYGGIGKTTLVKQFLDEIYELNNKIGLLFIDSNEIIDHLARIAKADKKIDDLYDFYVAQSKEEHTAPIKGLSKDLLKLSVDNGNLIIVLDGLDEVIARLGSKFDVSSFISSISTLYSSNLERAKIIITCRDNFWTAPEGREGINELTLVPFNESLAREFFDKSFDSDKHKTQAAMTMAQKFALHKKEDEAGESIYIPYVLDTIVYLTKRQDEVDDESTGVEVKSKILSPEVSNDILVSSVCEREIKKLANVSVETQINFFIAFAVENRVSIYDIKSLFFDATAIRINDDTIEKLKGHPLLACNENIISFRYDFFYEYFKTLYIVRYFLAEKIEDLSPELVELLGSYVGFDNTFTRATYPRLKINDNLTVFALETIDALNEKALNTEHAERVRIRSAISGVFTLLLTLLRAKSSSGLDIATSTSLLHQVFERNGLLDGISLIRLSASDRARPIFDFRGKSIRNSHFERYEFFWDCLIDEETNFSHSTFIQLEPRSGIKPKFYSGTFSADCDTTDIQDIISIRAKEISDNTSSISTQLIQLFKLFYSRGNFYPQKQEYIRSKVFTGKLLPILLRKKVIIEYVDSEKATLKQYKVADEFRPIVKLVEQGGASLEFERVVKMFVSQP